jgi:hypothetical protein
MPIQARTLLITHRDLAYSTTRFDNGLVKAIATSAHADIAIWDELPSESFKCAALSLGKTPSDFDSCIIFIRFRVLDAADDFDWSGFDGKRVWLEQDAWQSYSPAYPRWKGRYPPAFKRHQFDAMITTGKRTAELLSQSGVIAHWVPKAYDQASFHDLGQPRSGVCTFGTMWPSRRTLLHRLSKDGVRVDDVSGPFETLNRRLNTHSACVVCNMTGKPPLGRAGRLINRFFPEFLTVWDGIEPMAKTFEAAGAGCAPIIDHLDELTDLGFIDGINCYIYRTFDDAVAITKSLDDAAAIEAGKAAAELVRTRHTWADRGRQVARILEDL